MTLHSATQSDAVMMTVVPTISLTRAYQRHQDIRSRLPDACFPSAPVYAGSLIPVVIANLGTYPAPPNPTSPV